MMEQNTRTTLLDSAERAVRARGYDGFSYADLAEDVGIRKASIHYHFPTKSALSLALIDRYHSRFDAACSTIRATHATAAKQLSAMIDLYRDALAGGRQLCLCIAFTISKESLPADVMDKVGQFRAMVLAHLTAIFAQSQDDGTIRAADAPKEEARATLALLEGAHLAARAGEDIAIFDGSLSLLRKRLS